MMRFQRWLERIKFNDIITTPTPFWMETAMTMNFKLGFELEFLSGIDYGRSREDLTNKLGCRWETRGLERREYVFWNMVRDGSIGQIAENDESRWPCEIISPVFDLELGLDWIRRIFEWVSETGGNTNKTTGFHVGISFESDALDIRNIDKTKLVMLLDEEGILDKFNRNGNRYCRSHRALLSRNVESFEDKYCFVNFLKLRRNPAYLEFRGMGGTKYHQKYDLIESSIRHFQQSIASAMIPDTQEEFKERLKTFHSV